MLVGNLLIQIVSCYTVTVVWAQCIHQTRDYINVLAAHKYKLCSAMLVQYIVYLNDTRLMGNSAATALERGIFSQELRARERESEISQAAIPSLLNISCYVHV